MKKRNSTRYASESGELLPPPEDSREGEAKASSPRGKKRAASEDLEVETSKQGKKTSPEGFAATGILNICPEP